MKIVKIEDFKVDAGWRTCSFLKVTTDEGLVGWSEFVEGWLIIGVTDLIHQFSRVVMGMDPREVGRVTSTLQAVMRLASSAVYRQAMAAIENACLDIKARALGVPVYALFGGPFRDTIPVYWSHCGSMRVLKPNYFEKELGRPPIRSLNDLKRLGEEAVSRGFKAIKTNPIFFDGPKPRMFDGGGSMAAGFHDRNIDDRFIPGVTDQLSAFREGIGPHTGLAIDIHFSQRTEGYRRVAKAVEPFNLMWLEVDILDPQALALVRRSTSTPIASLESIHGQRDYRPYFENYSVDTALVDGLWNGLWESVRIATLADVYEVDITPHNWTGDLGNLINAHLAASVPNFRMMECEIDDIPWKGDFLINPPVIKDGELRLPTGPGWGTEINEEAIREHPPKERYDSF
jgi:galactonate dehydratase